MIIVGLTKMDFWGDIQQQHPSPPPNDMWGSKRGGGGHGFVVCVCVENNNNDNNKLNRGGNFGLQHHCTSKIKIIRLLMWRHVSKIPLFCSPPLHIAERVNLWKRLPNRLPLSPIFKECIYSFNAKFNIYKFVIKHWHGCIFSI